jgi:inorganic pyrophosphatase
VHYPGDYGFVPGTLSDDGDPLDALVLVTDPTFTGCLISARPIGVLLMTDEKGQDEKILAVPERDPRFEEMSDLSDLPRHLLKELEHFFGVYKDLEDKATAVLGWESVPRARQIITTAIAAYENKQA